jgi:subtilase family serine protease
MRDVTSIQYRFLVAVLVVFLAGGSWVASPAFASTTSPLVVVTAAPGWTTGAPVVDSVPTERSASVTVYIRQARSAEAAAFAEAVSDPRNPLYRHFLSPTEYQARFSADDNSVAAVDRFLRDQGLTIEFVPANHLYVRATGSVGHIGRAFHTTLVNYRHNGTITAAPSGPLSVPAGIAPLIAGVSGLDAGTAVRTSPTPTAADVCSSYAFQHTTTLPAAYGHTVFPTKGCGYTPAQMHGAYNTTGLLAHGIDGRGVRVAVLLFYPIPTAVADINRFSTGHGLPPLAAGQYTEVLPAGGFVEPPPALCPLPNDQQEAEGDLEMVHIMAPGAHLTYVPAASCTPEDILAATNTIVDQHLADIVTNSYTLAFSSVPAAVVDAAHQTFVQAAAEGIGLFYGSGDLGDVSSFLGTPQTTWPESDPFVTSVGGTSLFIGSHDNRDAEVGWGMTLDPVVGSGDQASYQDPPPGQFFLGSGGGITLYPQPAYQRGIVPTALAGTDHPRRVVPDIAADADLATGVLVGLTFNGTYQEGPGGGTSVSSPLFAGMEALADQVGGPHGFVNPLLYRLHDTGILHDVTNVPIPLALAFSLNGASFLDTLQTDTSLTATPGYDDQTGLGSPNGAAYVTALAHRPATRH